MWFKIRIFVVSNFVLELIIFLFPTTYVHDTGWSYSLKDFHLGGLSAAFFWYSQNFPFFLSPLAQWVFVDPVVWRIHTLCWFKFFFHLCQFIHLCDQNFNLVALLHLCLYDFLAEFYHYILCSFHLLYLFLVMHPLEVVYGLIFVCLCSFVHVRRIFESMFSWACIAVSFLQLVILFEERLIIIPPFVGLDFLFPLHQFLLVEHITIVHFFDGMCDFFVLSQMISIFFSFACSFLNLAEYIAKFSSASQGSSVFFSFSGFSRFVKLIH